MIGPLDLQVPQQIREIPVPFANSENYREREPSAPFAFDANPTLAIFVPWIAIRPTSIKMLLGIERQGLGL